MREIRRELHLHLKQADDDYKRVKYNTVVSAGMKMLNVLESAPAEATPAAVELAREGLSLLLRVLNPVVPHIAHALWEHLGYAAKHGDILDAPWPKVDTAALAQEDPTGTYQCHQPLLVQQRTQGLQVVPPPDQRRQRHAKIRSWS